MLTASNGAAALELLHGVHPDLILLEYQKMPVMDGWQFALRYQQLATPRPPVIVLTAAPDAQKRAVEVAADGYLSKPFEP